MPVIAQAFIQQHLRALERGQAKPNAEAERVHLLQSYGERQTARTIIDLRIVSHGDVEYLFEMKSGKPNQGQCLEMKERLMKAVAIRGSENSLAYWAVPYDPYGRGHYRHTYPLRFFDFSREVMMGSDFWDFVGGDGTYTELTDIY